MSENDYIAEYIKQMHPELIRTAHFYFWKLLRKIKYKEGKE